jgi:hypothetical protein
MFIVEKDNKIILAGTDREKLKSTLKFMSNAGDIVETERVVVELDGELVYEDSEQYIEYKKQLRITELKQLLADADYWTSKHADGEYTEEEWAEKVAIRKAWRAEINELELVVDNSATVE